MKNTTSQRPTSNTESTVPKICIAEELRALPMARVADIRAVLGKTYEYLLGSSAGESMRFCGVVRLWSSGVVGQGKGR